MSSARPNSATLPSVLLVTGEQESPVERAFEQLLGHPTWLHKVKLDREVDKVAVKCISEAWARFKPQSVLASSAAAWNTLRVLNIWQSQAGLFRDPNGSKSKPSSIMALPGYSGKTLLDYYAGDPATDNWLNRFLKEFRRQRELSVENDDARDRLALLNRALLGAVAANARHSITLPGAANDHGRNDVIAAIRVLQGAMLEGVLSAKDGRTSCEKLIFLASQSHSGLVLGERWKNTGFFDLVSQYVGPRRTPLGHDLFSSILVADDSGFWVDPFRPVWKRLGLQAISAKVPAQVTKALRQAAKSSRPVRVILLDMRFNDDTLAGAKVLSAISKEFKHIPVVALSVDDQFSETVLLKRMGAFAYLNKHALAEPHRGRDSASAFRQMQDAILAAVFASLAEDLRNLFQEIIRAWWTMSKVELAQARKMGGITETTWDLSGNRSISLFEIAVEQVVDVIIDESRRMFHGFWQDKQYPQGLACRQIIRALGVLNDKWCSTWKAWRFDPDVNMEFWKFPVDVQLPHRIYHQITTTIRNEASHGMVEDGQFRWLDVWIMGLTAFLKMEGTCRAYLQRMVPQCDFQTYQFQVKPRMATFVECLASLMATVLDDPTIHQHRDKPVARMDELARQLDERLTLHPPARYPEGFSEGDERRLSIQPYIFSLQGIYRPFHFLTAKSSWKSVPVELVGAHRLLMNLILRRVSQVPRT